MNNADADSNSAESALRRYGIGRASLTRLNIGLINRTWLVNADKTKYILQQVNSMFGEEVHEDIDVVTRHLHDQGLATPRLLHTTDNQRCIRQGDKLWRLYTHLDGITCNTVTEPALAYEAGAVLARFHRALLDLDYQFKNRRSGVHDTARHLFNLRTALQARQGHPRYMDVQPLALEILEHAGRLPVLPDLAPRKVHGDPKINNCLFSRETHTGLCMLDFDTLSDMVLPLELGDAMRSWCNPAGENAGDASFSVDNFRAALEGYGGIAREFISPEEWNSILPATQIIYVELASRFCADALNEDFFSWDSERFASHSEHSQVRATSQLNACKSLDRQLRDAERILAAGY